MVLGLRSKTKRFTSVQVEYIVDVLEIKPWPASQSLRSVHSVVLQWENGDKNFGLTNPITPSLTEGKIEINESFKLQVTLVKEISKGISDSVSFHKNILQLHLHEHKKDKTVKRQQLGTAVLDLAQHIKDSSGVAVPMNFKKSFRNIAQPIIYVKLQYFEINGAESSSRNDLSKKMSLEREGKESVSTLMSEEYANEDEIASFTDDDVSSHSSLTNSFSFVESSADLALQSNPEEQSQVENLSKTDLKGDREEGQAGDNFIAKIIHKEAKLEKSKQEFILHAASLEENNSSAQSSTIGLSDTSTTHILSSHHEAVVEDTYRIINRNIKSDEQEVQTNLIGLLTEEIVSKELLKEEINADDTMSNTLVSNSHLSKVRLEEGQVINIKSKESWVEESLPEKSSKNTEVISIISGTNIYNSNVLSENGNFSLSHDFKDIAVLDDVSGCGVRPLSNKGAKENIKNVFRFTSSFSEGKVHELECKVERLEAELRETAAIEIGLYSVVAEHGRSVHKVYTPARRLSRLYLHASKLLSRERRAGAARSVVSGLVMVAKACGNDIPRLTFWLSNSIVLRAIVSHAKQSKNHKSCDDWGDSQKFVTALEKIEAWIFSRIVESVWWQSFTPYMQFSKDDESKTFSKLKKRFEREYSLDEKLRRNCSVEIWKKAFQDACDRLCPVRGDGHECGCLSVQAKLVMEQCMGRLDVALFNALLRELDDETATDPVADPIINHKVLPIPPGKPSFGAGVILKNAIGDWSRSLTGLFGVDVDDSFLDKNNEKDNVRAYFKPFHLLNALSDLYMLPKNMLLEENVRKEVCPTFSSSVIRRILTSFIPDEFCPDQVPASVFEALDSEDQIVNNEDGMLRNLPSSVFPISYSPPSAASIQSIIGNVQSISSVVRKCHASDDELDELDSPLSAIILEKLSSPSVNTKEKSSRNPIRYQLLRDVWKFDD